MKKSYDDFLIYILSSLPLLLLGLNVFFNILVTDTDALAYHLYYARVINEQHLNFFSNRPVDLDNSLGFSLSAYYPWLYSHIIASIEYYLRVTYDNATYIFAGFLYLCLLKNLRGNYKIPFLFLLAIPVVYKHLFLNGTNYFLTITLAFYAFKIIYDDQSRIAPFKFLIAGFFLISTHVFGIVFLSVFLLYEALSLKRKSFFAAYLLLVACNFFNNYVLTGSVTFPFLQDLFPHREYSSQEWLVVTNQLQREISYEVNRSSIWYLLAILSFGFIVFKVQYLVLKEKLLILILLSPALLLFILGFRHRVQFLCISILIFLYIMQKTGVGLSNIAFELYEYIKCNIKTFALICAILLCGLLYASSLLSYFYIKKTPSIFQVKDCFYSTVSDLTLNNKVLLSEIELMRIKNPNNIFVPDGRHYSEMKKLSLNSEFLDYLNDNKVRYVTQSPISNKRSPYYIEDSYSRFLPLLIKEGKLKLVKDCVKENNIDNSIMPYYGDSQFNGWRIYEVQVK